MPRGNEGLGTDDERGEGALRPHESRGFVAVIVDIEATWGHQELPLSMVTALVRGVAPLPVWMCRDFGEHLLRTARRFGRRWRS
jgi:hypothetical protein